MDAGWYDNPDGTNSVRFFDGQNWTEQVEWLGPKPVDAPQTVSPPQAAVPTATTPTAADPATSTPTAGAQNIAPAPVSQGGSRKGLFLGLTALLLVVVLGAALVFQLSRGEATETSSDRDSRVEVDEEEEGEGEDEDEGEAAADSEVEDTDDADTDDAATTTTSAPATTTEPAPATTEPPPPTTVPSAPPCAAAFAGQETEVQITGVNDWVNGRSAPGVQSEVVAQLPLGATGTAFVDHVEFLDRAWVPVLLNSQQTCAWVDRSFLKSGTRLLGNPSATSYVIRALNGLDAEAAHANRVVTEGGVDLDPISDEALAALASSVDTLRNLGAQLGDSAIVEPDVSATFNDSEPGCAFNDLRSCSVFIRSGDQTVAHVVVVYAGNGVSDVFIQTS